MWIFYYGVPATQSVIKNSSNIDPFLLPCLILAGISWYAFTRYVARD